MTREYFVLEVVVLETGKVGKWKISQRLGQEPNWDGYTSRSEHV